MSESPISRAPSASELPPGYRRARIGRAIVVAQPAAFPFVEAAIAQFGTVYDYAARHPETEAIPGRSTVFVVPGPGAERWLVRRLTHGGLLAPLTRDRFLRFGRPRPFNELWLSHRFRELKIATPRVVAAAVYPSGPVYRGEVARDYIADGDDLAACLFADDRFTDDYRREAMAAAGRLLCSLFEAGVVHRDLNLRNVLVRRSGGVGEAERLDAAILDIEKCSLRRSLSEGQRRRMIERFRRSARRFEERTRRRVDPAEWQAFHAALDLKRP
jgi:hypothetical protein